ncbi:hypothetical protein [Novosphingobium sp. FKTRR1]|uniref:hypothetical protein n=1 Tax=unclassified Novosphingobium TaxID=2644732 RepID=UPI001CF020D5|nr:hypothetical protein [Novosphingobium sp. FKTRR1]
MQALPQCWFTRFHRPERERYREPDGSVSSTCRYCQRAIVSWDREDWSLADGFDVSRLALLVSGRLLTLYDKAADFVVRRYSVAHLNDEEAIVAYKRQLRAEYGLDEPYSVLELRDSQPRASSHRAPSGKQAIKRLARQALQFPSESDQNLMS